ncbi:hypothetical protein TrLO_g10029 [Triparma laevis f. longispina]|uniref:Tetraspanin n=1 Tax=Triparma laevis f. longispina TaxID=1714387 RepID=A0A9W6ZR90_9STRA|nr:hypothetical protein TrLO_g10029 [Triparma laevis f. longispina]
MCTPANLRLIFMALCLTKSIQMTFMFAFGIMTALDIKFHQAYGQHIKAIGVMLSCMSVFGSFNMWLGLKGSMMHNKFLLFLHAVLDGFAFFAQLWLGWSILEVTFPEFDMFTRELCSQNSPLPLDAKEDCMKYVQSQRTSGFQMVWRSYYYESGRDPNFFQKIIDIQRDGQCCGFGPPMRCLKYDEGEFPHNNKFDGFYFKGTVSAGDEDWDLYSSQRQLCNYGTANKYWYPSLPLSGDVQSESEECNQIINLLEVPPQYGGCMYDMPLGTCKEVREMNIYNGCMFEIENVMNAEMAPSSIVILGLSLLQVLAIIAACCFCWKRKQFDTFPDALSNVPYDPFKNAKIDIAGALERKIHQPKHERPGIEFIEE